MSIEFETIADNCTPRNALFCCRSPVCLNNSPKLVPIMSNATMDAQQQQIEQSKVFPVCVPDLSDAGFYTSLMTQPNTKLCNDAPKTDLNATMQPPSKMNEINKSQSAQDVRTLPYSLRRVTPPKCTVSVKKQDNPMMNVVLRKVFYHFPNAFIISPWTLKHLPLSLFTNFPNAKSFRPQFPNRISKHKLIIQTYTNTTTLINTFANVILRRSR